MPAVATEEHTLESDQKVPWTLDEPTVRLSVRSHPRAQRLSETAMFTEAGPHTVPASGSVSAIEAEEELTDVGMPAPPVAAQERQPFTLLQQWEGIVSTEPSDGEFSAVLRDLTSPVRPEEQATFSIDQVPPPDRKLAVPGGVFYWAIGYEDSPTGTRRTVSLLRFRRLPAWTRSDMRRIAHEVERLKRVFCASTE